MLVDALDDIDFAPVGPEGTESPEGGPSAASERHVLDVDNDQALVVKSIARDPDCGTTTGCNAGAIGTHDCIVGRLLDQPSCLAVGTALVVDKAVGRVRSSVERELVEEVSVEVVVLEDILGQAGGPQSQDQARESGKGRHIEMNEWLCDSSQEEGSDWKGIKSLYRSKAGWKGEKEDCLIP